MERACGRHKRWSLCEARSHGGMRVSTSQTLESVSTCARSHGGMCVVGGVKAELDFSPLRKINKDEERFTSCCTCWIKQSNWETRIE